MTGKGRVTVRNEGADADHMRLERFHVKQIFYDMLSGLSRRSDHDAASHLITDLFEIVETPLPVPDGHLRRMKVSVVHGIGCLLPQQISVGARIEPGLVRAFVPLPDGERNCAVRIQRLDPGYDLTDLRVGKGHVLPALQDKCAKSQRVSLTAALQDLLSAQPVSVRSLVAPSDAAVIAVISAVIGKLYEPAQIDIFPVGLLSHRPRALKQTGLLFCAER